jgi:hypothetical protein
MRPKIRCDGYCTKIFKFFGDLNMTLVAASITCTSNALPLQCQCLALIAGHVVVLVKSSRTPVP